MMEAATTKGMVFDYSEILQAYGLSYSPIDYYWRVGDPKQTQGWVLHLSVIRAQFQKLLESIIPGLLEQGLSFQIIRDARLAFDLLEGSLGYAALGKMVAIYPGNEKKAQDIAQWLLAATSSFRGPQIPTDRHLGGVVYTRYGSINPVLVKDTNGGWVNHIYDVHGQLIRDPYLIPFTIPEGIAWPFGDIAVPDKPKRRKLLNYKYYPLFILKPDAKGDVIRALYFKRLWQIKSCLIKQGRPNMFTDDHGRDIQDRLRWQYELYQVLHKDIPMPQVFDYFEDDGSTYLAMEFIKGQTLTSWISAVYKDRSWLYLPQAERIQLLDQLLKILVIISRLHKKGYIHRDITPENFLVDKKGRLFLIDMELTWSATTRQPLPPFQLGTPGHMSPEQIASETPTDKEDIFGTGSLIFVFLTNFYALKLIEQDVSHLLQSLQFFSGDQSIACCIAKCWAIIPSERPRLEDIIYIIENYREKIVKEKNNESGSLQREVIPNPVDLRRVVQGGINNLGSRALSDSKGRWISQSLKKEVHILNQQSGLEMYEGWHTGMAGPLWLAALAKRAGFSIDACQTPYAQSLDFILQSYSGRQDRISPGLYAGHAGIALALIEGLNSGLLAPEQDVLDRVAQCFSMTADQPGLAEGVAGQGLALLQSLEWIDSAFATRMLASYVDTLIEKQNPDGSWNFYTGVDYGTAGILLFLLSYLEKCPQNNVRLSVTKSLEWLENIGKKEANQYSWPIRTNTKLMDRWSLGMGMPGIALAFIKAYDVLKAPSYRRTAEQCLGNITPYPILIDLSLGSGLAGLGEIYLEAYRVFKDFSWQERANWIANVLFHCYKQTREDTGHWLTFIADITTAGLFSGNGGIIHFLLRTLYPDDIGHPFLD